PFENRSKAPGLDWIGEAFSEVLTQRMASPALYLIPRKDRRYAFERSGVPTNVALSRATLFKIAQQIDVDKALLGSYSYDGSVFQAHGLVLDMHSLRAQSEITESGPLTKVLDIMSALAWDLQRQANPSLLVSKNQFLESWNPVRLDAFEDYIRGVNSTGRDKI